MAERTDATAQRLPPQASEAPVRKPVTDAFYSDLKKACTAIEEGVTGLRGETRRQFAELLTCRILFLKFVESKGWLDGDTNYLQHKFMQQSREGYWKSCLFYLLFQSLNCHPRERPPSVNGLLGNVPFLNDRLFTFSDRWDDMAVDVEDDAFRLLFDRLLTHYNYHVSATHTWEVGGSFDQDLLGSAYEQLLADRHGRGSYYTQPPEASFMCRESLRAYLDSHCPRIECDLIERLVYGVLDEHEMIAGMDNGDAKVLLRALRTVTVVDPALGSGTLLVTFMRHLYRVMRVLRHFLHASETPSAEKATTRYTDERHAFDLKRHILEECLHGCDVDAAAVEIARLRLWLECVVECEAPVPLPNFDFNLIVGDALAGVVGIDRSRNTFTLQRTAGLQDGSDRPAGIDPLLERSASLRFKYYRAKTARTRARLLINLYAARETLMGHVRSDIHKNPCTSPQVHWPIEFPEIFLRPEGGFNIVLTNPPYLRCERIPALTRSSLQGTYSRLFPNLEISRKADLYVYYYLRASMLAGRRGVISVLCSNSWLDVGYGRPLRAHLLTTTRILGVYESAVERSFSRAEVNSAVTLCEHTDREDALRWHARFVLFRIGFASIDWDLMRGIRTGSGSRETNGYRLSVVLQRSALERLIDGKRTGAGRRQYWGGKWGGGYLHAPVAFQQLLEDKRAKLCQLSDLCEVLGYIHDNNTGEGYPLAPFVKTVKDLETILLTAGSKGVRRYGVRREGTSGATAPILFPRTLGSRHLIVWNPDGVYGKEFYKIIPKHGNELLVLSQLVSSLGMLQRELVGTTSLGDGALKFCGEDLKLFWLVRDLPRAAMENAFRALAARPVLDYRGELLQKDRQQLDRIIFDQLGLTERERREIYEAVDVLVTNRLQRARSRGEPWAQTAIPARRMRSSRVQRL